MKKEKKVFTIKADQVPKVLLLGNGMLKLGNKGTSWDELLKKIQNRPINPSALHDKVPYAMQPEALCGVNVEQIQRDVANNINSLKECHSLLKELLKLPFDAILTTNYTYEIEAVLSGKEWPGKQERLKAFTVLDGSGRVNHNTFVCNSVTASDGRIIPVFHIHGEAARKHSMILSYYSYANALSRLVDYNKNILKNSLFEHQEEEKDYRCRCWLDYFILGEVWSIGFGLDVSEFDVWWAIERKAREKAAHGRFKAYFDREPSKNIAQKLLLDAMDADYKTIPVFENNYEKMYQSVISEIKFEMKKNR